MILFMDNFSKKYIKNLIDESNNSLINAYSRMDMENQAWTKYTESEVSFIEQFIPSKASLIVDMGCGSARHIAELYKRGYTNVYGYDFSENLIEKAKKNYPEIKDRLFVSDCRKINLKQKADVILCLYDVIGSFENKRENLLIANQLKKNCKKGGIVISSVMNFELTKHNAKHIFNIYKEPKRLFQMEASSTMQKSGNIFNPDFYIIHKGSHVVYRKEMFTNDGLLDSEYIVRDRRYTMKEIKNIFTHRAFAILDSRYVQAGKWTTQLTPVDSKAKEILLVAKRR